MQYNASTRKMKKKHQKYRKDATGIRFRWKWRWIDSKTNVRILPWLYLTFFDLLGPQHNKSIIANNNLQQADFVKKMTTERRGTHKIFTMSIIHPYNKNHFADFTAIKCFVTSFAQGTVFLQKNPKTVFRILSRHGQNQFRSPFVSRIMKFRKRNLSSQRWLK